MKKLLTSVLTVAVLVALASTASAVTCTIDQKPAATLLVPYFQVGLNTDGTIPAGGSAGYKDTLITIGNASDVPTLAHVTLWTNHSIPILDFMIALTPNDIQSLSLLDILGNGNLPATPSSLVPTTYDPGVDVCQRSGGAEWPAVDGYLRFIPGSTTNAGYTTFGLNDNLVATTQYGPGAIPLGLLQQFWDAFDGVDPCHLESAYSGSVPNQLEGYVTIDMVNYCTIGFPDNFGTYQWDADGWENNLWGDYILVSGAGVPTFGNPTVNIEADTVGLNWGNVAGPIRNFYARYWEAPDGTDYGDNGTTTNGDESTNGYLATVFPNLFPNFTFGDMREPLGETWAARYVTCGETTSSGCALPVSSFVRVWRGSANGTVDNGFGVPASDLIDLSGGTCTATEPLVASAVYDEDENQTSTGGCFSPCHAAHFNYLYETQRSDVQNGDALDPTDGAFFSSAPAANGWVFLDFMNTGDPNTTDLDQAWVGYDFQAGIAFINSGIEGTSLDKSDCNPVGTATSEITAIIAPAIPAK